MLYVSVFSIFVLLFIIMFSPLSMQYREDGAIRASASHILDIDSLVASKDFSIALIKVDSIIELKSKSLPHFAYFDRFMSKEERYKATLSRIEIYDLQWKRIEILRAQNNIVLLRQALDDYSDIIGYNQEMAKSLLEEIKLK